MNNSTFQKTAFTLAALALPVLSAHAQTGAAAANEDLLCGLLIGFGLMFLVIILVLNNAISGLGGNRKLWESKNGNKAASVAAILMLLSGSASAASPDAPVLGIFSQYSTTFWVLLFFDLFLLLIIIVQLRVFRKMVEALREKDAVTEPETEVVAEPAESVWMKKIMSLLTKSVPVEREEEVMTDHEYDGIRELDNVLPPWWVAMMYMTIIFAVVYLVHYHVIGTGDLQLVELRKDIEEADAEIAAYIALTKAQVDETNVTVVTDANRLASGEKIYVANCVACHGTLGEGGVGPNFADEYWIHGGSVNEIFSVIKYGVPSKGMISWRAQLSPTQIQDVSSYILTFQGTNPPNAKEPQGDLYVPEVPVESEEGESDEAQPDEQDEQNEEAAEEEVEVADNMESEQS